MKQIKLSTYDKIFIIYLLALSVILISTFFYNHVWADEGTHLLLAVFYKDLISYVFQTHTLSFKNLYAYGVNYLVSYPKLQIAYTPLFHLTTSIAFFIFGVSEFVGRFVNLLYAIGSFSIFYIIVKKFFDPRVALISTILFSLSPISLTYGSRAMMDFTAIFWLLLSLYVFSIALKKNNLKYYSLTGFLIFLAAMGKQMGVFVALFTLVLIFKNPFKKSNWNFSNFKKSLTLLLTFAVFFVPYLFIMNMVGGIKINELVAIGYASDQSEPTSLLDYNFWLYYVYKPLAIFPLAPLFLVSLAFYVYKKNSNWEPLLFFFLIFYLCLTIIPNKELRFSQFFLLPTYITASYYLNKLKRHFAIIAILLYALFSFLMFLPGIVSYPTKDISQYIYENNKQGGNVALFSEDEPLYSSSLMWYTRLLDNNRNIRFYRSCVFENKNETEIVSLMKENNIQFVIYSSWSSEVMIEKIKNRLQLEKEIVSNDYKTQIYVFKDFSYSNNKKCNFVCLTKEMICSL